MPSSVRAAARAGRPAGAGPGPGATAGARIAVRHMLIGGGLRGGRTSPRYDWRGLVQAAWELERLGVGCVPPAARAAGGQW